MAYELIVNDRYYSYTVTGALKRITRLCNELQKYDDDDRNGRSYLSTEIYDLNDYIDFYAKKYEDYVTRRQLIKICKYKVIIDKLKEKETRDDIIGKMQYYLDEYNNFLESIGLKLHDTTQDKLLYELLN
jgi:hypothetical protein